MANTEDLIGEIETLDGLISHSLDSFEDDRIAYLRRSAFQGNDTLKSVTLPFCRETIANSFYNCYRIEDVSIPLVSILNQDDFSNCYKLKNLSIPLLTNLNRERVFSHCYSLNSLDFSKVTRVYANSLRHSGFGKIILSSCTTLGAMGENVRLSTIDLGKQIAITGSNFANVCSLCHLILRSESMCTLSGSSAFENTPIANGIGWIYVPSDLVESYKTASNWSAYASQIVSIDEYPKSLQNETISDSWGQIFASCDNNTYKTKYSVGDIKYLVVGDTYVPMQIVAFDRDILSSDGVSTAKITWISTGASFVYKMNFSNSSVNGWENCECRDFLRNTIYPQIDSVVRNRIVPVNKTYNYRAEATSATTTTGELSDTVWIPSVREIFGQTSESFGVDYADFFNSTAKKQKAYGMTLPSIYWWTRTIHANATFFSYIDVSGNRGNAGASGSYGIVLGFCTN